MQPGRSGGKDVKNGIGQAASSIGKSRKGVQALARRNQILNHVFMVNVNGQDIPLESLTPEQWAEKRVELNRAAGENLSAQLSERPDLYRKFCESETVKKYDAEV